MGRKRRNSSGGSKHRAGFTAGLGLALVVGALFTAVAVGSAEYAWLAWISLLPLFFAIRTLAPAAATLAGAFWGLTLYAFAVAGAAPSVSPTLSSLALLAAIPAIYAGLGSRLTRAIGYNPLLLAFGWIGVEIALRPLGLHHGLFALTRSGDTLVHGLAGVFGYVFVAFVIACANASLVSILSGARLSFPAYRSLAGSPNAVGWFPSQVILAIQSWTLRQAQARAPPPPTVG